MIVKVGITSVKGKISSKNAIIFPLGPPKSILKRNAEMGAQTVSIHSPMPGITYDNIPIKSISMHNHSGGSDLLMGGCILFICVHAINAIILPTKFIGKKNQMLRGILVR